MKKTITLTINTRDIKRVLETGGIDDLSRNFCDIDDPVFTGDEEILGLQAEWKAMAPIFERLRMAVSQAAYLAVVDLSVSTKISLTLPDFELSDDEIVNIRKNSIEPRVMCDMSAGALTELAGDPVLANMSRAFDDLARWLSRIYQSMLSEMLGKDEVIALDFKF